METKANYVAVGAFLLACVMGLVVTILWLAGAEYNQDYSYYQAHFNGPVTGLGKGTDTRFNGITVGRVTDLVFDPNDPQSVIVTLQVQSGLNIREDSVASIDSQGITGAPFVQISGGTKNSPALTAKPGQKYPLIRTRQSTLQELQQSIPAIVAKLNVTTSRLNDLLNDDNRREISNILASLNQATSAIANRSADIDATLRNTNQTSANLRDASADLRPAIAEANATLKKYGKVADDADAFINGNEVAQLADLISESRRLVASLTKFSDQLNRDPTKLIFGDQRKGYEPK